MRKSSSLILGFILLFFIIIYFLGKTSSNSPFNKNYEETYPFTVTNVVDGDTIWIKDPEGSSLKIRLYGIDAPETNQPFGKEARDFLASKILNKRVKVDVTDIDRYHRSIAKIELPDKVNVNLELVKQGLAWWYKFYAPFDRELEMAHEDARYQKKGLWSQENPIEPYIWRKSHRSGREDVHRRHQTRYNTRKDRRSKRF